MNPNSEIASAWTHFLASAKKRLAFLSDALLLKLFGTLACLWVLCAALVYHFERGAEHANIQSFGDGLWWGMVTLLTVGYGDRFPVTTEGRMVGGLLMMSGVVAIGS